MRISSVSGVNPIIKQDRFVINTGKNINNQIHFGTGGDSFTRTQKSQYAAVPTLEDTRKLLIQNGVDKSAAEKMLKKLIPLAVKDNYRKISAIISGTAKAETSFGDNCMSDTNSIDRRFSYLFHRKQAVIMGEFGLSQEERKKYIKQAVESGDIPGNPKLAKKVKKVQLEVKNMDNEQIMDALVDDVIKSTYRASQKPSKENIPKFSPESRFEDAKKILTLETNSDMEKFAKERIGNFFYEEDGRVVVKAIKKKLEKTLSPADFAHLNDENTDGIVFEYTKKRLKNSGLNI